MNSQRLKANLLLTLTALIWGTGFVAQRVGMDHVGPYTFNGIRFALGALALLPLVWRLNRSGAAVSSQATGKTYAWAGIVAGSAMFLGATLQQVGLQYTTAGKAGFITGLYVIFVPMIGLLFRQRTNLSTWIGAIIAVIGMYFLSITEEMTISYGDLLQLIGALFWAVHVLVVGWLSPRMDPIKLSSAQFAACAVLSLGFAVTLEDITAAGIVGASLPLLYGGLISVGIAYTLQVVAQRDAHPAHAAIILCFEAVFAAVAGYFLLGETLTSRGIFGCCLMFGGILLSQVPMPRRRRQTA